MRLRDQVWGTLVPRVPSTARKREIVKWERQEPIGVSPLKAEKGFCRLTFAFPHHVRSKFLEMESLPTFLAVDSTVVSFFLLLSSFLTIFMQSCSFLFQLNFAALPYLRDLERHITSLRVKGLRRVLF
jgi:hypothetical protein